MAGLLITVRGGRSCHALVYGNQIFHRICFAARPAYCPFAIHIFETKWCILSCVGRTNVDIDDGLIRKARKLTRLKTKRQIVDKALELLVRSESRKGILRFYGSGVWKGDLRASRRNRV